MKRMRIVLFGTGHYYSIYHKFFTNHYVVALLDNNAEKEGQYLDGVRIVSPEKVGLFSYDRIYILSTHADEMTKQLLSFGVSIKSIFYFYEIAEISGVRVDIPSFFLPSNNTQKSIVLISDDLKYSGAQLDLLDSAEILKNNGYYVAVASASHGKVEEYLKEKQIPYIIDERISMGRLSDLEWTEHFDLILINTITFFYLLLNRNTNIPTILWSHEPDLFYQDKYKEKMKDIDGHNLFSYAVSQNARQAMLKYNPNLKVDILTIGRHDRGGALSHISDEYLRVIMVGEVGVLKGQDILCKAMGLLPIEEQNKLRVRFIGRIQGNYDLSFLEPWKKRGILEVISEIPRESLDEEYTHADVLVCASRAESLSAVVIEAMQHGVMSIVTEIAGIAEYLHDGEDGLIFRPEDPDDLSRKIHYCINEREAVHNMGIMARELFLREFDIKVFERRLLNIIRNHLG